MKICIAGIEGTAHTGKGKFAQRLAMEFERLGVAVTGDKSDKVDIALHIGHIRYKSRAHKDILRLGPARVSTHEDYKKLNATRYKSMKLADGIVFQSKYSRKAMHKFVGHEKCPYAIIYNAVSYSWYDEVVRPRMVSARNVFVASTRKWIAQKRLGDIVEAFRISAVPDSILFVLGNTLGQAKKYRCDNVRYVGECNELTVASYLLAATAVVHAVYLDACPNSVAEAIGARAPVICTDQGGTVEMLEGWKYIAVQDKQFKYKPVNLDKPPHLDRVALAGAMRYAADMNWDDCPRPDRCDIGFAANEYLNFFEEVLVG